MKSIADCFLYGILDLGYVRLEHAARMAAEMIAGGIDVIQLRAKNLAEAEILSIAKDLKPITDEAGAPLIINDYPTLASAVGAEGVHLGQDDAPISEIKSVDHTIMIGKSTHSVAQAVAAQSEGANYIGFGPLFATPTKPDYVPIGLADIARVDELVRIPIFCIGGIKLENLASVLEAGAKRVVIVSGILKAPDIIEYTRNAKALLLANPKS
ncbi:MAG: thiamine phosphate synthase [Verrucomicrobiota bacterium]|nr:thiamine phosphate synthase [Verrucomicrobiota bacterium]